MIERLTIVVRPLSVRLGNAFWLLAFYIQVFLNPYLKVIKKGPRN